jgi:uncharacterized damage-inducible protein DinB
MASERANALADALAAANEEAIVFAESCTPEQWRTDVPGESWTVGVVLHHIAEGHANALRWLTVMAAGAPVVDTRDDIDDRNVDHAERYAAVSVADTVVLLRTNGARTEAALRNLSDEDLARTAEFGPADGRALPVEQMANVTAGHVQGHLASARHAVGVGA